MMDPITRFTVVPDYNTGAVFTWEVSKGLRDPGPWTFQVELAEGPDGPWSAISPVLSLTARWQDPVVRRAGKDHVFFYRLTLRTSTAVYRSSVITPYGDLGRREFLLARDVMRREYLHCKTLAGNEIDLWLVSTWGPPCTVCLDPITGNITNTNCPQCLGTGHEIPYNGPYTLYGLFSTTKNETSMATDGTGLRQPGNKEVRAIGALMAKKNDVVVPRKGGERYYVDDVESIVELQTIPVVQRMTVRQVPQTDIIYTLGK